MKIKQVYNPYLPINEYIPDGEPHVFEDRLYIFGSHDKAGSDTYCSLDYVVYSAPVTDLTEWRCDGVIYSALQDPHSKEEVLGAGKREYLFAPDVVRGNDGKYYLYYCLSAKGGAGGFDGPISVAVSDTPAGRYTYYGDVKYPDKRLLKRYVPFDPAVINDGGRIYLYYGWAFMAKHSKDSDENNLRRIKKMFHKDDDEIARDGLNIMGANVVELERDMLTVKSGPERIIPCHRLAAGTEFYEHAFFEASLIRKIGNLYYFIYSTMVQHELAYAVSRYPDREFHFGGVIISNGDVGYDGRSESNKTANTGTNHGSIECINGQWYIFYHRNTNLTSFSRQGMAEKIDIGTDGSIKQVEMTSCGLNKDALLTDRIYPSVIACNLSDGSMPHNGNYEDGRIIPVIVEKDDICYIENIHDGTYIGYKYFSFQGHSGLSIVYRGIGNGVLRVYTDKAMSDEIGRYSITPNPYWTELCIDIYENGIKPLFFVYEGEGTIQMLEFGWK
ncbi:MAG: family 43 glycosylhydrolase [Eubacteriales bacterium]|nr:family 43 glycosylhydrolase [Eubacteriales bacterium]